MSAVPCLIMVVGAYGIKFFFKFQFTTECERKRVIGYTLARPRLERPQNLTIVWRSSPQVLNAENLI